MYLRESTSGVVEGEGGDREADTLLVGLHPKTLGS